MANHRETRRRETWIGLIAIWVGMPGFFLCAAGILVLGWQVYVWVKFGMWQHKPLRAVVLDLVERDTSWLSHPDSFVLLQSWVTDALDIVPLSGFLIALGLAFITVAYRIGGAPPAIREVSFSNDNGTAHREDNGNG